jgi:hypothetical protein
MEFFRTSTANLLKAEVEAGVNHHVALSVVGTERLQESGYFRAKQIQPIHSGDVAAAVGRTTVGAPLYGMVEVAGPTRSGWTSSFARAWRPRTTPVRS